MGAGLLVKDASLSAPGPGQLAQLNVAGTYQSQPLIVSLTAVQPERLNVGGPLRVSLSAQAAGATLSAHGTMPPGLNAIGLDMTVNLRANDLSALSPLLGVRLPPAQNLSLSAQFGDAGMKLNGVALRNLISTSSLGDFSGDVTFNWAPRPAIAGALTSHSVNLDALFAQPLPPAPQPGRQRPSRRLCLRRQRGISSSQA